MKTKEGKAGHANLWNLLVMKRRNWWVPLVVVLTIGAGSMGFVGVKTYTDAPPVPDFISESGDLIVPADSIKNGQTIFLKYALMEHGSMFGDGAGRGPDYTAEALHQSAVYMREYYQSKENTTGMRPKEILSSLRQGRSMLMQRLCNITMPFSRKIVPMRLNRPDTFPIPAN